jgi:hypothetical protein
VVSFPDVTGLGWSKVRALAKELTASEPLEDLLDAVVPLLDAPDVPRAAFTDRRVLAPR